MPVAPNPGNRSNPEPPYTMAENCPSDEEIARLRELAEQGLALAKLLEEVLDEMEIYFDLGPIISRLKEEL